ncbi:tyrosine-protein kinase receptor TYRO3 [Lingula anatina]|uniref:receptor protein-tyrosine kinase n=1 Tax=Lingula anatina TaxID=7574 RepID=A0A1S3HP84_LINAN|nr:tyrosine-protein kinase receptor TYRO3 [Lingula anatina]|eukprot:XP_013387863.1 tyrosine-protein kinase receptor TYRO3 [Lingula anatina]
MLIPDLPTSVSLSLVGKSTSDPIQAGSQVVFQCTTPDGNPAPILQIYRGSTAVSNTGSSPLRYTRTILDTDNQATFTCKATATGVTGETTSTGITLTNVQFAPSAISLSQSPSGPVRAGSQDITLSCRTSSASNPALTVAWQRVRGGATTIITTAVHTTTSTDTSNQGTNVISTLTLSRPGKEYNGDQYNCLMTYKTSTPLQKSAVLNITYPPDRSTAVVSPVTVTEDQTPGPILRCEFVDKGNPEAVSFEWIFPGQSNVARTGLTYQISPISITSAGTYQCRPYNSVGSGQAASIMVVVHATSYIGAAPQNITVNESDVSVQLRCEARGKPVPSITWTFNSQLVSTQLYTVLNTSQINSETQYDTVSSTLTLAGPGRTGNTVNRTDQGFYTCEANNSVGNTTEKMAYINVQHRADLNPDKITNREVAMDINTEAVLTLYVTANPVAIVYTWTKQNGNLPANSTQETNIERQETTLRIPDLMDNDYGTYICTVLNAVGVSQFVFVLERRGKPDPPSDLKLLRSSAISVTLQWTSNKNGGYSQTFYIFYKVSGSDWRTITDIPDPGYKQNVVAKVENLLENTEYIFKVLSFNFAGSGGFSNEFRVTTKDKPVITQFDLTVSVSGNVATVKWSPPEGYFTSYGIQYCVQGTTLCDTLKINNVTTTSADIILPGGDGQYELSLIVYQGDDAVVNISLPFVQKGPVAQGSSPVGVVVGVLAAMVLVTVTVAFAFIYLRRRRQKHNNANRNFNRNRRNGANELSVIQSRKEDEVYEKPNPPDYTESTYTVLKSGNDQVSGDSVFADIQKRNWEIRRRNIKILEKIGSGAFGQVFMGKVFDLNNRKCWTAVAVKTIEDDKDAAALNDLKNEIKVMKTLSPHPNVIQLLAACTMDGGTPLIVLEYIPNGNLQDFLRKDRSQNKAVYGNLYGISSSLTSRDLIKFALDVASGMVHLSSMEILHRDLAARNILVGEDKTCKISDFGFAKDVIESHKYEKKTQGRLPVRWMSPEALFDNIFTTQSDVWAYGVLLWEIVTLGSSPYPGMSAKQVMEAITEGYRMPQPPHCSQDMYNIMLSCWEDIPSSRPSFKEITVSLNDFLMRDCDVLTFEKFEEKLYEDIDQYKLDEKC